MAHNHAPETDKQLEGQRVRTIAKRKAEEEPLESASKIVCAEVAQCVKLSYKDIDRLKSVVKRICRKQQPVLLKKRQESVCLLAEDSPEMESMQLVVQVCVGLKQQ